MATPVAEAFILVKPDLTGFETEVRGALIPHLRALEQKPPQIPISLDLPKAEIERIQGLINNIKATVTVEAPATTTGRRGRAAAAQPTEPVTVPVVPGRLEAPARASGVAVVTVVADQGALISSIDDIVRNIEPKPIVLVTAQLTEASKKALQNLTGTITTNVKPAKAPTQEEPTTVEVQAGEVKAPPKATGVTEVDVTVNKTSLIDNIRDVVRNISPSAKANIEANATTLAKSIRDIAKNIEPKPVVPVTAEFAKGTAEKLGQDIGAAAQGAAQDVADNPPTRKKKIKETADKAIQEGADQVKEEADATDQLAQGADKAVKPTQRLKNEMVALAQVAQQLADVEAIAESKTRSLATLQEAAAKAADVLAQAQTRSKNAVAATLGKNDELSVQLRSVASETVTAAERALANLQARADTVQRAADERAKNRQRQRDRDAARQRANDEAQVVRERTEPLQARVSERQPVVEQAQQQVATLQQALAAAAAQTAQGIHGSFAAIDVEMEQAIAATKDFAKATRDADAAERELKNLGKDAPKALRAELEQTAESARELANQIKALGPQAKIAEGQLKIVQGLRTLPNVGAAADTALGKAQLREAEAARLDKAAFNELAAAKKAEEKETNSSTTARRISAEALKKETAETLRVERAERERQQNLDKRSRQLGQASRGIAASALSFLGLRAQVLAASAPFIAGTVAVTAFAKAIGSFVSLQQQLNVFQATTGATAQQMRDVSAAAKELGRDITLPGVSAGDAATAMSELAKAGLSVKESIAGARGVLQLATAAQISQADSAQLVASALNAFSLSGTEAVHVADLLANAANAAQGSIEDFGTAMQQAAAVSSQVGVNLEDMTALLTLLARAGLRGSDAGTSLRTALLRLASPTQQARQLIKDLGLTIRDAQGQIDPTVFAKFAQATEGLSADVRDAIAGVIFGQDAIRAALLAGRQGISGLEDVQLALDKQGTAAELAAARTKGLAGEGSQLKNNFDALAETFGETFAPALEGVAHAANFGLGALNNQLNKADEHRKKIAALREEFLKLNITIQDLKEQGLSEGDIEQITNPVNVLAGKLVTLRASIEKAGDTRGGLLGFARRVTGAEAVRGVFDTGEGPLEKARKQLDALRADAKGKPIGLADVADVKQLEQIREELQTFLPEALQSTRSNLEEAGKGFIDAAERGREFHNTIDESADAASRFAASQNLHQEAFNISNELRSNIEFLQKAGPGATGEQIDAARTSVENLTKSLLAMGPVGVQEFKRIGAAAKTLGQDVAQVLSEPLAAAISDFTGVKGLVPPQLTNEVRDEINLLAQVGEPGIAKLRGIGQKLARALAEGIQDEKQKVTDARQALDDALLARTEAVQKAASSARENLGTLGDELTKQISEMIDAGPLQKQIDAIDKQLDKFEKDSTQRTLRFNLSQAESDLEDLKQSLVTIGAPNAVQRQQIAKTLAPAQEAAAAARDALTKDSLERQKKGLEDQQQAAKDAAEKGIKKLVDQFLRGKLTANQFSRAIQDKLSPQIKLLKGQAGENLGLTFTKGFMANLRDIVKQAQFLVGFLGTPEPTKAIDVKKEQTEQDRKVQAAQRTLNKAIQAQIDTADELGPQGTINQTLIAIHNAIVRSSGKGKIIAPNPVKTNDEKNNRNTGAVTTGSKP